MNLQKLYDQMDELLDHIASVGEEVRDGIEEARDGIEDSLLDWAEALNNAAEEAEADQPEGSSLLKEEYLAERLDDLLTVVREVAEQMERDRKKVNGDD